MKTIFFLIFTTISLSYYSQTKQKVDGNIIDLYTNDCGDLRFIFKDSNGKKLDLGLSNNLLEKDLSAFIKDTFDGYVIVNDKVSLYISNIREIICVSADNMDAGIVVYKVIPTVVDIKFR